MLSERQLRCHHPQEALPDHPHSGALFCTLTTHLGHCHYMLLHQQPFQDPDWVLLSPCFWHPLHAAACLGLWDPHMLE